MSGKIISIYRKKFRVKPELPDYAVWVHIGIFIFLLAAIVFEAALLVKEIGYGKSRSAPGIVKSAFVYTHNAMGNTQNVRGNLHSASCISQRTPDNAGSALHNRNSTLTNKNSALHKRNSTI